MVIVRPHRVYFQAQSLTASHGLIENHLIVSLDALVITEIFLVKIIEVIFPR